MFENASIIALLKGNFMISLRTQFAAAAIAFGTLLSAQANAWQGQKHGPRINGNIVDVRKMHLDTVYTNTDGTMTYYFNRDSDHPKDHFAPGVESNATFFSVTVAPDGTVRNYWIGGDTHQGMVGISRTTVTPHSSENPNGPLDVVTGFGNKGKTVPASPELATAVREQVQIAINGPIRQWKQQQPSSQPGN